MKVTVIENSFPLEDGDYTYISVKTPCIGFILDEAHGFKMPKEEDITLPLCQYCGGVSYEGINNKSN